MKWPFVLKTHKLVNSSTDSEPLQGAKMNREAKFHENTDKNLFVQLRKDERYGRVSGPFVGG